MKKIDTRGYSCPEPVLMVKRALAKDGAPLTVLADNQTPLENITRFAKNAGYQVKSRVQGEDWEITIS
jgi:tRNA 2-thiouridine synthesizing protein A